MTPLGRRLLVAAGGIPLLLVTAWAGDWSFRLLVSVLGVLAVEETYALLAPDSPRSLVWPARVFVSLAPWLILPLRMDWLMLFWVLSGLAVSLGALRFGPDRGGRAAPAAITLLFYPGALLLHFAWLREQLGWEVVFFLFALLWIGDTAAYAGGRMMGRHKLAPSISPNKTWEGALWALALCLVTGWITSMLWVTSPYGLTWMLVTAVTVWVFGTLGDLFESLLKRNAGVKDSSGILSEHGGILDRFDSLLFAAVPVYYLGLWWR